MKKIVIINKSMENPWRNLAYETCLLQKVAKENRNNANKIAVLFLWQNNNTIVIGRNQNPWKECNMDYVKEKGIQIARRITGGGAVYHDNGNLNFSFILPIEQYNIQETSEVVVEAFNRLGIAVEVSGRNDILMDKRKFSGNAYYKMEGAGLHHGTILISSDNQKISACLTPDKVKLKTKGIKSVSSRVVNVSSLYPDITMAEIKNSLIEVFTEKYSELNTTIETHINIDNNEYESTSKKYSSNEWIYDDFNDEKNIIKGHFNWGNIEVKFDLSDDVISACKIITDSLEVEVFDFVQQILLERKLEKCSIKELMDTCYDGKSEIEKQIVTDIMILIYERLN